MIRFFLFLPIQDYSIEENRFIIMGESIENKLLVVSFVERPSATHLITARKETRAERKNYEEEI